MISAGFKDLILMAWVKELQRWLGVEGCILIFMAVFCSESCFAILLHIADRYFSFPFYVHSWLCSLGSFMGFIVRLTKIWVWFSEAAAENVENVFDVCMINIDRIWHPISYACRCLLLSWIHFSFFCLFFSASSCFVVLRRVSLIVQELV